MVKKCLRGPYFNRPNSAILMQILGQSLPYHQRKNGMVTDMYLSLLVTRINANFHKIMGLGHGIKYLFDKCCLKLWKTVILGPELTKKAQKRPKMHMYKHCFLCTIKPSVTITPLNHIKK